MTDCTYDAIVVGAGIEGSAIAYTLAKNGLQTLLLEKCAEYALGGDKVLFKVLGDPSMWLSTCGDSDHKFQLPHARGSSGGATRIIRKAYEEPVYVNMMIDAYPMWHTLEKETGVDLYKETGLLLIDKPPFPFIEQSIREFKRYGLPYTEFSNEELTKRYPTFRVPEGYKGCLDICGGTLKADECLKCYQDMFTKFGGRLHDDEPVVDVIPGDVITVNTPKASYRTRHVVLAAGGWSNQILEPLGVSLPLQVVNMSSCYWKETDMENTFPHAFILTKVCPWPRQEIPDDAGMIDFKIYGLPTYDGFDNMKICLHVGYETDPDKKDEETRTGDIESLGETIRKYFPTLDTTAPAKVERCLYINTPDHNPFIDRHPKWKNILIATGFSGHGFKLAPVVGKLLLEMIKGQAPSFDMSTFRIDRFEK